MGCGNAFFLPRTCLYRISLFISAMGRAAERIHTEAFSGFSRFMLFSRSSVSNVSTAAKNSARSIAVTLPLPLPLPQRSRLSSSTHAAELNHAAGGNDGRQAAALNEPKSITFDIGRHTFKALVGTGATKAYGRRRKTGSSGKNAIYGHMYAGRGRSVTSHALCGRGQVTRFGNHALFDICVFIVHEEQETRSFSSFINYGLPDIFYFVFVI